jgi:glycosyltransferase involved in cell wall biosynthesis
MAPHAPLPKTYVLSSHYISLARCAQDYRRMLEQLGCLATCPDEADVIFLHSTLGQAWPTLMATPGFADRYLVGYLVWEADRLAQKNLRLLPLFDAIWTPSWYSARSFVPHHERVRWLPHVIRPAKVPSPQAIAQLESVLGPPGPCELLQIGRPHDPRKAFTEAAQAAQAAAYGRPGLTLVQKVMLAETDASASPVARRQGAVVELTGHFDEDLMAALYARAHYVFSNHHSEGWGLTLSEGMAAGTPAIASNYSGNLTYMGPQSNILIDGVESEVRDLDRSESFEAPMRWHYALPGHIEQAIGRAYDMVGSPEYEAMAQQGRRIGKVYDERHVRLMMRKLLMDIADAQRAGERPRPKDLLGLQRMAL